jgi:hypothetical protein
MKTKLRLTQLVLIGAFAASSAFAQEYEFKGGY